MCWPAAFTSTTSSSQVTLAEVRADSSQSAPVNYNDASCPSPALDDLEFRSLSEDLLAEMSEGAFSILAVCTGNVCRSPAVERLLATKLGPTITVSSAGTHALVGHPISEPMAALLAGYGIDERPFEARRVSEQMLKEADLILPLNRAQRSLVVDLWPAAVRRTFTLREFARLLHRVDASVLPTSSPAVR